MRKATRLIIYYTDGSTAPTNPGPGGYSVIKGEMKDGKLVLEPHILDSEPGMTTNIRMEGLAIIAALRDARGAECEIRTDSLFWINVVTQWVEKWRKVNFKDKKNPDIVMEMDRLYRQSPNCTLVHVKGHKGEVGNEMADEWANKAREGVRL